ncbi:MAG: hypothetical protein JWQ62_2636 [Lacunisphaera sp.]|nr:hypothetical protein [Lacunisphaera sp.]
MKTLLRFLVLLVAFLSANAADLPEKIIGPDKLSAAVMAADDERLGATKAGDGARLDAIFSEQLHYAHSSGHIDTKASYMEALTSHRTVYESFEYLERNFVPAAPGIVLMNGHVIIHSSKDGEKVINDLNFLAVWREENGRWRFLAWQSCKNQPPAPPAK